MKRLLSRHGGRSPRATLRIDTEDEPPSVKNAGGGVLVTVTLLPEESFVLIRGWLELQLATTHFSRTVLDGYREHTSEEVWQTVEFFENVQARPGDALVYSTILRIPQAPPAHSRPARMRWQAKASFEHEGGRAFSATTGLRNLAPHESGTPVVDGTGFLPLYEFRSDPDS